MILQTVIFVLLIHDKGGNDMSEKVTNEAILQAVVEMSDELRGVSRRQDEMQTEIKSISQRQDEMQTEIKGMQSEIKGLSQRQDEMQTEIKSLSQKLTDIDNRLNEKVDIVSAKIDIVSNRILETQAEVNVLKKAK